MNDIVIKDMDGDTLTFKFLPPDDEPAILQVVGMGNRELDGIYITEPDLDTLISGFIRIREIIMAHGKQ